MVLLVHPQMQTMPPDACYPSSRNLHMRPQFACKTPICIWGPNLTGPTYSFMYIYVLGSESACGVSICMLGCRFRPHLQIWTHAELNLIFSKNVHQPNLIYSCDTMCHMIVPNITGFYPSPKSFWSCTHVNSC